MFGIPIRSWGRKSSIKLFGEVANNVSLEVMSCICQLNLSYARCVIAFCATQLLILVRDRAPFSNHKSVELKVITWLSYSTLLLLCYFS